MQQAGSKEGVPLEVSPREFVSHLQDYAVHYRAVEHPLLDAIAEGTFEQPEEALKDLLGQYYFYSYRFTQYLAAVIARLESPRHRAMLVCNMAEESGNLDPEHEALLLGLGIDSALARVPHPVLFQRFLEAIGMDVGQLLRSTPDVATQAWIQTFQAICRDEEPAQAIGALGVATEAIVRHMYLRLLRGIQRVWPELPPKDRVFFDLHASVDDDHAAVLMEIATELASTPRGRTGLWVGTIRALDARANFFDHMLLRLQVRFGLRSGTTIAR